MLSKFQIDPVYRLGAMAKISSGLVKIQQQQLQGADLSVEMDSCSMHLARGHLHKENNQKLVAKPHAIRKTNACSNDRPQ